MLNCEMVSPFVQSQALMCHIFETVSCSRSGKSLYCAPVWSFTGTESQIPLDIIYQNSPRHEEVVFETVLMMLNQTQCALQCV